MRQKFTILTSVLLLTTALSFATDNKPKEKTVVTKEEVKQPVTPLKDDGTIKWYSFEEAVELNKTNPKQFFIDFYTSWCGWCKVLDTKTFQDKYIAKYMSENFYCVKFDAEQKADIAFEGRVWKWLPGGRNGIHELAAYFMQNQLSYPTCVILTPKFELVTPLKGYVKVEEFEPLITFMGKELYRYKGNNFEQYKANYKRVD
ncbi:MAG: DUF255 domain-containing protein [Chitinophagales bacterium]|nr:DUF255 domain-containing protein [Chitinophagales bacterium]